MEEEKIKELIVELERRMKKDRWYLVHFSILYNEGFIAGLKCAASIETTLTPWLERQFLDIQEESKIGVLK